MNHGCSLDLTSSVILCKETASPFGTAQVSIPQHAESLAFEYRFINPGDGDYVAVFLDNILIWTLAGSSYIGGGEFVDSGPIQLGDLKGDRTLTVAMYGVGEANAAFEIQSFASESPNTFIDDDGSSVFETDIEWLAASGITRGCNPPDNDRFCPDSTVTRGQMAAFLTRALGLTDRLDNPFTDERRLDLPSRHRASRRCGDHQGL